MGKALSAYHISYPLWRNNEKEMEKIEHLDCEITKVVFRRSETGYTVLGGRDEDGDPVTVVGPLADVTEGEYLSVDGEWFNNSKYGEQFSAAKWTTGKPKTKEGILKYLSTFTKGIGPVYSQRIVAQFGTRAIDILDNYPERLKEIPGIGKKRIEKIQKSWNQQKSIREVMMFLQSNGITPGIALRIYKAYGDNSIKLIKENPYRLADEVKGIGFTTADKLALSLGLSRDSFNRLRSGIFYALNQVSNDGHVFAHRDQLVRKTLALLDVDEVKVQATLDDMLKNEEVEKEDEDAIYLKPLLYAEMGIASNLKRLMQGSTKLKADIPALEHKMGMTYDPAQAAAIQSAMENKVMVLTGGPGTGKTTVTRGIIAALSETCPDIVLAAPTGRAAKRMEETTGKTAATIHRLLEYKPEMGFGHDASDPIDGDVLIVDEASMIDTVLMNALLRAVPDDARLLLVGDVDQLPSVGAGCVLRDIIDSGVVPVFRLTKIFRQAAESKIIMNCHRINEGHLPDIKTEKSADFFFIEDNDPGHTAAQIVDLVSKRLPKAYGYNPTDIQVLTPQKSSLVGSVALNAALQEQLNPSTDSLTCGGVTFRKGDKVMQTVNNYDTLVFNGDVGFITEIDEEEENAVINFDGRLVEYEFSDFTDVSLAYATTIHKSQGSEYPAVIIPVNEANHIMLERHLIYTGFSRAKKLLVVIGSKAALAYAIQHEGATKRNTMLKERLIENSLAK